MPYGYGPVAFATFGGFILGMYEASLQSATGNTLIQTAGIISLVLGLFLMLVRRNAIIGMPGGLITGFGLGATLGTYIWPPVPQIIIMLLH